MADETKKGSSLKGQSRPAGRLELAAMGMEAEFSVTVDGEARRPEDVFGSPRAFVRGDLMHRQGTSYHLPTGGAVYFDTGVVEVATPVIEIERGAARARGARCGKASCTCARSWTTGSAPRAARCGSRGSARTTT